MEKTDIEAPNNIIMIDGKPYTEEIVCVNGFKITNRYPVMSEEEGRKKQEQILYELYRYFNDKD